MLALLAGVVTVVGTLIAANRQVKTANDAADREIKAANEAADRQIAAAQEQTKAAQHQTAVTREIERRRIAQEGYAFHAMLEAAMTAVIEDGETARKLPPVSGSSAYSTAAYAIRRRIKRVGFAELHPAFLHFGGPQTAQFLQLDQEIEALTVEPPLQMQLEQHVGLNTGLLEQLDRIERLAITLRDHAVKGVKLCRDELDKELI